ncbi:hypothetical protein AX16_000989 [Volvariella volvacea WC 439]|nr:hypothetical protein AX16_000989 [Volvariella volvacea WC 439]
MVGNILSALIWIKSTTFATYMLSRVVGGLSEGNVQLAIAILSDVTTPANRSKALAHVGIAFAVCFCIGPPIGAYFASRPLPSSMNKWGVELNIYATPAILTLMLLLAETVFLLVALPETRGKGASLAANQKNLQGVKVSSLNMDGSSVGVHANGPRNNTNGTSAKRGVETRIQLLKISRRIHFLFLCLFSGVEFTLTFLTFDLLDWNNKQNGALIGSIGVISALLQGGYVRRAVAKVGEGKMARRGVSSCALALIFLSLLPYYADSSPATALKFLQAASICMAFTSATVVNSLTAFASLQCDDGNFDPDTGKVLEEHPDLAKGKALGRFRSSGQLGRAIGPILACASYWTFGPSVTYAASALAMVALSTGMKRHTALSISH